VIIVEIVQVLERKGCQRVQYAALSWRQSAARELLLVAEIRYLGIAELSAKSKYRFPAHRDKVECSGVSKAACTISTILRVGDIRGLHPVVDGFKHGF
jgi:hypothetical protein